MSDMINDTLGTSVAGTRSGAPLWVILGSATAIGLLAFLWMGAHRAKPAQDAEAPIPVEASAVSPAAPAPPEVAAMQNASRTPPAPAPAPVPPSLPADLPRPFQPPPLMNDPSAAAKAPVMVIDLAQPTAGVPAPPAKGPAGAAPGSEGKAGAGLSGDESFAARVGAEEPDGARATMIHDKGAMAPQGTLIPAVLETALDSDLPGFARAVVSQDVRSFDGSHVLITRGSRLIGEYRSATAQGQTRAFVIWTRLIRPDGVSIQLGSPGADDLGRGGMSGQVDRHFLERFGGAILLSVVNAGGTALAGHSPGTEVVIGSSQQATGLASIANIGPANIAPTIKVPQGSPIRVFVARDLDFGSVPEASR